MTVRASLLTGIAAFVTCLLVIVSSSTFDAQESEKSARGTAALLNPGTANEQAPAIFRATFETSVGTFVVAVHREWSPIGADRFYDLVKRGYYDGCRFFRMTTMTAQFGI